MLSPATERRRLEVGASPDEQPFGIGAIDVVATCAGDATAVLARVREVLTPIVDHQVGDWPSLDVWERLLPQWFVDACAPEMSQEEAERWVARVNALPPAEQAAAMQNQWALADWLYWLEPEQREWFWWDAHIESPDQLVILVEVSGWPAPFGALEWLLRAAGAISVAVAP